jgi:hypothetical protein
MHIDDMILISVDDHVVEPRDMFERHVGPAYRARAPRVIKNRHGDDMWEFEGQLRPNVGLNAVAGRPPEEYGYEPTGYDQMRRGCFDVHERVRDMNVNGVLASMCFGSFPSFCGRLWAMTKANSRWSCCAPTTTGTSTSGARRIRTVHPTRATPAVGHRSHGR